MDSVIAVDVLIVKKITLVFFLLLWAAILARLVFSRRGRYRQHALMPLDDEHPVDPRNSIT